MQEKLLRLNGLTTLQAFNAMRKFLEGYYSRTSSDVGSLLGDLEILQDGGTADPAAWDDWTDAVNLVMDKMNDPFIDVSEIKSELKEIENLGQTLARNLSLLSQKIKYILSKIKSIEKMEDVDEYLTFLDEIASTLSRVVYKEEIGIPERLARFIKNFDNTYENKEFYFIKIKSGEYYF